MSFDPNQSESTHTALATPVVRVRLVRPHEMDAVYRLTHDCYVEKGYAQPQPDGRLRHYHHLDGVPQTMVLVAEEDGHIVASNSVTVDGPQGLPVDSDFPREAAAIRAEGKLIGSSWRIVVHKQSRVARHVILALIHETIAHGMRLNIETCLFTINPGHESVYRRLLGLEGIARRPTIHGLSNAPAVLMRGDVHRMAVRWERTTGRALPRIITSGDSTVQQVA